VVAVAVADLAVAALAVPVVVVQALRLLRSAVDRLHGEMTLIRSVCT